MDKTVYVLGAGFSAPLDIPTMSNFYEKSKDQYYANPEKHQYFLKVFETIREIHVSKSYYSTDLTNIEEILSILEMSENFGDGVVETTFKQYIIDVIKHYTPPITDQNPRSSRWFEQLFGVNPTWDLYGSFISSLFNLQFDMRESSDHGKVLRKFYCTKKSELSNYYAIISLNYDLVIETICDYINRNYEIVDRIEFCRNINAERAKPPFLAKLHGSIDTGLIIPPTWNKSISQQEIIASWKLAHKLLTEANHIRFLGYSLPVTDSYIKYLLRSSVVDAPNLKTIDVICLDDNKGIVKQRYDDFIVWKNYRYKSISLEKYFKKIIEKCKQFNDDSMGRRTAATFYAIEHAHNEFMEEGVS